MGSEEALKADVGQELRLHQDTGAQVTRGPWLGVWILFEVWQEVGGGCVRLLELTQTGWTQKVLCSQFWSYTSKIKVSVGLVPSEGL